MFNIFKREKNEYNYFDFFQEISSLIVETIGILSINLKKYQLSSLEEKIKEIQKKESIADEKKKYMMSYLYQDFLPPIEREDIIEMAHGLDIVLENIGNI